MAGLKLKYFVLKPKGTDIFAHASREAMQTYAKIVQKDNPEFAADLEQWAEKEATAIPMPEIDAYTARG